MMLKTENILKQRLEHDKRTDYFLYMPKEKPAEKIFVAVHGFSLNAASHCERFIPLAEQFGFAVIAPLFDTAIYPSYNCLELDNEELRTDRILDNIIDEVCLEHNLNGKSFILSGYSAGGQFAHRYAICYPERVEALCMGAPGFYTMPSFQWNYPFGLEGFEKSLAGRINLKGFLKIPICLAVGGNDLLRNSSLYTDEIVDSAQGENRVERAHTWYESLSEERNKQSIITTTQMVLLENCGHSFEDCIDIGGMDKVFMNFISKVFNN